MVGLYLWPKIVIYASTGPVLVLRIALDQNNPNHFNPSTTIKIDVHALRDGASEISLTVFNLLDQKVATFYKGVVDTGIY